ncbi:cytochrome P450 [Nocardia cyriacigeorgica]|nr:cytochrome P450 [Nocardia cyriacigeorgica]MBF6317474.1 cytochrome P450 [Nocardia cyriacigeorgica]MBF6345481.1 cytochrome P450 [Nocardia cyriacigeorgica]MBF6514454.1 cytochrome P450 [Nocardia cyriacigeorgica]MBF6531974.1 cytochrome P450 [Nocardia cyriacigeorgica]
MRVDPLPTLARMRAEAPIVRVFNPHQQAPEWRITRYADVTALLRDERFSKDKRKLSDAARSRYFRVTEFDRLDRHMLFADPPEHTRLRGLVAKAFTPRRIMQLRPYAAAATESLLDQAERQESVDLLDALAFRLPIAVLAELIGVPSEDQEQFRKWTSILVAAPSNGDFDAVRRMVIEFHAYLEHFLETRRRRPRDDLTSALIEAQTLGDCLSPDELMSMIFLLIAAGFETTGNLIGNGVWALLRHPAQLRRLQATPTLIGSAIEEVLRYCPPVKNSTGVFPLTDVEFRGTLIPAEELVVASLMSAHHDDEQFAEPSRFDIARTPNRHLGFGLGAHFCLGAALARLEAAVAIGAVVRRFPRLRFAAEPNTLRWKDGVFVHGLEHLPVTWGTR